MTASRRRELFEGQQAARVNRIHHQAVKKLGGGLSVEAVAPDGVIEAVRSKNTGWVYGV